MARAVVFVAMVLGCELCVASSARAATEASADAGGGLPAVTARVDLAAMVVRLASCARGPCALDAGAKAVPIALDRTLVPGDADVVIEPVDLGQGKHAVHVKVPAKGSRHLAWEALLAGGAARPIFADLTGPARGDEGERTGKVLELVDGEAGAKFVVVGDVREDVHLCGEELTPLSVSALDPRTMEFHGATMHRMPEKQRDEAQPIVAEAHAGPVAGGVKLLRATGSSVAGPSFAAVTDGDPTTTWSETRPGDGHGEFVVMSVPREVPIAKLVIVPSPPKPAATGAASKTFFLVTDDATFRVTMPGDAWLTPGGAYDVPLPPLRTSCLALVLDEAYDRGNAHPEVTVAELYALSAFPSMDAAAKALAGGGPQAEAAAHVLELGGPEALSAVVAAWGALDGPGRRFAADVAASQPCENGAPLLVLAATDKDRETARKGWEKLERCGKAAVPALTEGLAVESARAKIAPLLAAVGGGAAVGALANVAGQGPADARAAVRAALGEAAAGADRAALAALVGDAAASADTRLDVLRALAPRLHEFQAESDAALAATLQGSPSMRVRYLSIQPLAQLALAHDAAATNRLVALLQADREWPVRAGAAEGAAGIPEARDALALATADPEPRVREAALRALAPNLGDAWARAVTALGDDWTFVRLSAVTALAAAPATPAVRDALASRVDDPAPRVRAAAMTALGVRRDAAAAERVRAHLVDEEEDLDTRVAAARALGAMCDAGSLDVLTDLAKKAASPVASEDEASVGAASAQALGALKPPDLARRLTPLAAASSPPWIRELARRAQEGPGSCH